MKLFYLLLIVLLFTTSIIAAQSPFKGGSVYLTGSTSYSSYGGDAYRDAKIYSFNSQLGICIAQNLFISPGIAYTHITQQAYIYYGFNEYRLEEVSSSTWLIQPTLEYYFVGDKIIKRGINVPYISIITAFNGSGDEHINQYGGGFGVLYFVSDQISIDFAIRFTHDVSDRTYYSYPYGYGDSNLSGNTLQFGFGVKGFL
ncbi:MAG: hypothetical protein DWP97_09525 [Calditrichaeota bacterium]|nr:MAG: hypothetical protein DWP97_09525 [Calditrichota bacterium]